MGSNIIGERTPMTHDNGVVERPLAEGDSVPIEIDANFLVLAEALHALDKSLSEVELATIVSSFKERCYSKDKDEISYQKTIEAAAKLIDFLDEATLVACVHSKNFHRTVLERVLDKWSVDDEAESAGPFKKLVRIMVELDFLTYKPDVELTEDLAVAEYVGVLKTVEKFIDNHSAQQVVDAVLSGQIHLSLINKLHEDIVNGQSDLSSNFITKMKTIIDGLAEMQRVENKKIFEKLQRVAEILHGNSKEQILIMLARGILNPDEVIALSKKIESGGFLAHHELKLAVNEVRPELGFYKDLYRTEKTVQKAESFKQVAALVGSRRINLKLETLKILLDLYKAGIRQDSGGCKEKIKAALEEIDA